MKTRLLIAAVALATALVSGPAKAAVEDEWPPVFAPSSACVQLFFHDLCAFRATLGDVESLPAGDQELNALALLLGRSAYNDASREYDAKVAEYRASLEPAARARFPKREYDAVLVLSKAPLLVRTVTLTHEAQDTVDVGTPAYATYVRANAAKMGYPSLDLDEDLEQKPLANGAVCVGCFMQVTTKRGTKKVTGIEHGFVSMNPWLARTPLTTSAMAASALRSLRPQAATDPPDEAPTLAVLRDPFGKGRLVWAIERSANYVCRMPHDSNEQPPLWYTRDKAVVFALDVDSLAIVGSLRSDFYEKARAKAAKKAGERGAPAALPPKT